MRGMCRSIPVSGLAAFSLLWAAPSTGQLLTVERAVELALQRSTQVINAEAGVWDARGGVQGAYAGVLPRVSTSIERSGFWQESRTGSQVFGGQVFPIDRSDYEQFSTTPQISGTWSVLDLSSWVGLSSARNGLKAAKLQKNATRNDIALEARRQFYEVVKAAQLARVSAEASRLSRDDERRVGALFEVGSVSKSDVLKAQVRTAQSELDSLTSYHAVTFQRIALANLLGMPESQLGEVDTVLTAEPREFDEAALMAEAEKSRPDLLAAESDFRAAKSGLTSAHFRRLPYVTVSGSTTYRPRSNFKLTTLDTSGVPLAIPGEALGNRESDLEYSAAIALNWDVFDWFSTDSRIASARGRMIRARETRDALRRNLSSEVERALLLYREAVERDRVATRAVDSATESVKLTQQKYNVGSATILELIDAQVQLQRAKSDRVTALAAIRVAEAQIDRVRGHAQ